MTDTWQTPEWKEKAAIFVKGKACAWCGTTENLVPHHPKRKEGYTHDQYMDLEKYCFVLCSKCNFKEGQGYKLCPKCKKNYYKPSKKREALCWACFTETPFGKQVEEYYEKHPEHMSKKMKKLQSRKELVIEK